MTLGEYIAETEALISRFEKLAAKKDPEDSAEFVTLFDAIESRDEDIRMYRLRGLKNEDPLPGPPTRVLQIDWSTKGHEEAR
jgi:hypothetical protein